MTALPSPAVSMLTAPRAPGLIFNFVAFQLGWFACVVGAAHDWAWAGTAAAVAISVLHIMRAARPAQEMKLIVIAVGIGAVWDSSLVTLGWLSFPHGMLIPGMAPHWILGLWALLATTLNVSLNWLHGRWLLAAILGAVAGPVSYWAGVRLGAVGLVEPVTALAALAAGWAAMMPLLMWLARRHNGIRGVN